jgi:hypothetical protein
VTLLLVCVERVRFIALAHDHAITPRSIGRQG